MCSRSSYQVANVLGWVANGMTEQEILDEYPDLEEEDFKAAYEFAARMAERRTAG